MTSRSVVVCALTFGALALGCARPADDTAPAGYSVLKRAVERKFAEVRARDHETHLDDGYGYDSD